MGKEATTADAVRPGSWRSSIVALEQIDRLLRRAVNSRSSDICTVHDIRTVWIDPLLKSRTMNVKTAFDACTIELDSFREDVVGQRDRGVITHPGGR